MFLYWSTVIAQWFVAWRTNHCWDWILRTDLWEVCDDWNYNDGDGCDHNCQDESKKTMMPTNQEIQYDPSRVSETTTYKVFMHWKFSHTVQINSGQEICDYGSDNWVLCEPGYGGACYYCSSTCKLEKVQWHVCWDWVVHHLYEQCDDGNSQNWDWCNSLCNKENVFVVQPTNTSQTWITDIVINIQPEKKDDVKVTIPNKALTLPSDIPASDTSLLLPSSKDISVVEKKPVNTTTTTKIVIWSATPKITEVADKVNNNNVQQTQPVVKKEITKKEITKKEIIKKEVTVGISNTNETKVMSPLQLPLVETVDTGAPKMSLKVEADSWINDWRIVQWDMQMRQNILVRTSPTKAWIWITSPYPDKLSMTWASLLISSSTIFMWILSLFLSIYSFWLIWSRD